MKKINVFCHLYYSDSLEELLPYLKNLPPEETRFFFNILSDSDYTVSLFREIRNHFPGAIVTASPNDGKDIGGKFVLYDLSCKLNLLSSYIVMLHDKRSPHTSTGGAWKKKLLKILEPHNVARILNLFEKNPSIGIIAASDVIRNEYDERDKSFSCTSNDILLDLITHYHLQNSSFEFVAGTMFWVKAEGYYEFFSNHRPLAIRNNLENGNVLDHYNGTQTHAWERMLSWILLDRGYQLKGI